MDGGVASVRVSSVLSTAYDFVRARSASSDEFADSHGMKLDVHRSRLTRAELKFDRNLHDAAKIHEATTR